MYFIKKFLLFYFVVLGTLFLVVPVFATSASISNTEVVADTDQDGLSDIIETQLGVDPQNADTDGDGYLDGQEVYNGFNPLKGNRDRKVERQVRVNLTNQTLNYYFNKVLIGTMPVSTGIIRFATPTGEFKILRKLPVHRYTGLNYDYPNTKWNLEFKRGYYLHTAYWHNEFGKRPMSHGCVNMALKDVEKLYRFLDVGDKVKVTGKTPTKSLVQVAKN